MNTLISFSPFGRNLTELTSLVVVIIGIQATLSLIKLILYWGNCHQVHSQPSLAEVMRFAYSAGADHRDQGHHRIRAFLISAFLVSRRQLSEKLPNYADTVIGDNSGYAD